MKDFVNDILFDVITDEEDNWHGSVFLCCGPLSVRVCSDVRDFDDFVEKAIDKLRSMREEIKENYNDD